MDAEELIARAAVLRDLHRPGAPVVLPNAWDVATARAVEHAGFAAVATSSVAVAHALGFADGGTAPPDQMLAAAARIGAAVRVPMTVDLEDGYGLPAAELVERLVAAGGVGCNVEDTDHRAGGLVEPAAQAARLAAIRAAADQIGVPVVLNARVDVFLRRDGRGEADVLGEAVERGRRYLDSGADCVYPILCREEATIAALTEGIGGPVNVHWLPDGPPVPRLAELGVARVSTGGTLFHVAMDAFREAVDALL